MPLHTLLSTPAEKKEVQKNELLFHVPNYIRSISTTRLHIHNPQNHYTKMSYIFLKISNSIEIAREWAMRLRNHLYIYEKQEERLLREKAWIEAELKAVQKNKKDCQREIENNQTEIQTLEQDLCEAKKNHTS